MNLYKKKEGHVYKKFKKSREELLYPGFLEIEIVDTRKNRFKVIKNSQETFIKADSKILNYIPLLFYDDLLECMLQNLEKLNESVVEILNPSYLIDREIILLLETDKFQSNKISKYSWLREFNEINLDSILESIEPTFL